MSSPQKKPEKEWTTNDYAIQRVIGEGSYGRALLATEKETGQLIVVKEISFANLTEQEMKDARKETMILSLLCHPNIIGHKGSFLDKNIFHIIMDYADGGDLSEQIEKAAGSGYFTEEKILDWFVQICLALKHIHDRKILHRDLKTQNIFLMRNGTVKLGDFGIAKVLDHTASFAKTSIGTPYYLSPEICQGRSYNAKSDIWSLGCVLYEMCTLKHPFDSNCINGLIMKITRAKQAPIPKQYSQKMRELVDTLLQKSPQKRPNINQVLNIDFVHEKIGNLLSSTLKKIEFSHTIFHGVKGGLTPAFKPVDDNEDKSAQPNSNSNSTPNTSSSTKTRVSKLPTKKTTVSGTRNTAAQRGSSGTPTTSRPVSKPTGVSKPPVSSKPTSTPVAAKVSPKASPKSSPKPSPHAAAGSNGAPSNRPTTASSNSSNNSGSRPLTTSGQIRCDKTAQAAAAAEREAQIARREAEIAEKKRYEEEQEKKRQEFERKHQQREAERKKQQDLIKKGDAERKKKLENLEAPFKNFKNKTSPKPNTSAAGNDNENSNEVKAVQQKKRPVTHQSNEKEATSRSGTGKNRDKDVDDLRELIRQKKAAAKASKQDANSIQIGTMTFNMNGEPTNTNTNNADDEDVVEDEVVAENEDDVEDNGEDEEQKTPMRVEDLVLELGDDNEDDDELFTLAAIAQNLHDNPPEIDEGANDSEEDESTSARPNFLFKGKPIDLPPYEGQDPSSFYNEAVRKYIEKGLGAEKFLAVYKLVRDQSELLTEEQCDAELKKIIHTDEEMEYYPLVQQLVVAEVKE